MARITSSSSPLWLPRAAMMVVVLVACVIVAIGAYLLAIDGDPSCGARRATCPREFDTARVGWIAIGLGLLVAAVAAALSVRRRRQGQPKG
jgi:hypothetical protein